MYFVLTQIIGALGYLTISLSYHRKKKRDILITQIISYIFFTVHYSMLMAKTGTICNILGLISLILIYVFDKYFKKKKKILIIILMPIITVISLITYENLYSLLPIIASVLALISFLNDKTNTIRLIGIITTTCWFIYAIIYKSYIAIVFEVITIFSTIIAYTKNKKKN